MKKLVSIMAVAAFMLSMNVNAQEPKQKAKKDNFHRLLTNAFKIDCENTIKFSSKTLEQ